MNVEEFFKEIDHVKSEYILIGSFAMKQHGFYWNEEDVDLYASSEFIGKIKNAFASYVTYKDKFFVELTFDSLRVHITNHINGYDFDEVIERDDLLMSKYGRVLPIKDIVRSKLHAKREKDYRYVFSLLSEIMFQDNDIPWGLPK